MSPFGNDEILAHAIYEASLQIEFRGKGKGTSGAWSIRRENFKAVDFGNVGGVVCVD